MYIIESFAGVYSAKTGVLMLVYEIPQILGKAFPVGLLLGSLFTFDKLSKDSELTIFRAVGMSFPRIAAPLIVLSLFVSMLCFITYDKLIPYTCQKREEIKGTRVLTQFIYTQKDEKNRPNSAVIVSKFDSTKMHDVIVLDFADKIFKDLHGLENVLVAEAGYLSKTKSGESCWRLNNITSYNINSEGVFESIKKINSLEILVGEASKNAYKIMINSTRRDREFYNKELHDYVKLLKKEGFDEDYRLLLNKYYQRFLHPFVCVLLALLGCILGFSKPREQRLIGFTIAIACIFVYYITLPFFDLLAEKGVLLPFLCAVIPPSAFLGAIIAFYKSKDL